MVSGERHVDPVAWVCVLRKLMIVGRARGYCAFSGLA